MKEMYEAIANFGILVVIATLFLSGYLYDASVRRKRDTEDRNQRAKVEAEDRKRTIDIADADRKLKLEEQEENRKYQRERNEKYDLISEQLAVLMRDQIMSTNEFTDEFKQHRENMNKRFDRIELKVEKLGETSSRREIADEALKEIKEVKKIISKNQG